jgi:glycogen(starch) synthase
MRLALVPSSFAPSIGGVEDLTRQLAKELSKGYELEVWTSTASAPGSPKQERIDGIVVRRFDFPLPSARLGSVIPFPSRAWSAMRALEEAFEEFHPDLLHVVCFAPNGAYATELSRRRQIPLVITLQGETVMDDHDIYDKSVMLRACLRRGIRQAKIVTACSRYTLNDAARFGLEPRRGEVVFNGTSLDEIAAEPIETPFERYVLCLGRVVQKKGFDLMLAAFTHVVDRPGVGLVVAGGGQALPMLRQRADELGIGKFVCFTGPLGRAQVAGAMRDAAVFVMPSRLEPFGIVALEGWRGATPVVVSSRGGTSEFVRDGIDGIVVDPFDEVALSGAVNRLLDDRELAAAYVRSGLERLNDFTWPRIAERYRELYAEATQVASPLGH